jgi:hypothetical protein
LPNRLQHPVRGTAALLCLALGLALGTPAGVRAAPEAASSSDPAEAAAAPAPEASAPAPPEVSTPAVPARPSLPPMERLARAFQPLDPEEPLEERVERVRVEASRMGMWSAEPAARGLVLADHLGHEEERARAAVLLAPSLPAAWGALALAAPGVSSLPAMARGLLEMERNLDASVWWRATAWHALVWGVVVGGILFLLVSALRLAPVAAHDLSHRLPGRLPPHAIAAVLTCVGMLPAILGEGLVGLAAGAFFVALPWAGGSHRLALIATMAAVMGAVHPATGETGRWIAALRADPGTIAIRNAEYGSLTEAQLDRLARLAPRDPAASHALALWSKRSARLDEAAHWLEMAEAEDSAHPVLLNDAANLRLARGDDEGAIRLYEKSIQSGARAAVYFNLAQVHGSRIELSLQERALESAHAVSAATVRELSDLRGNGRLAVDVAWPVSELRGRLADAADGRPVAAALRRDFGTGRLVEDPWKGSGALLALAFVAVLVGRGREESRVCGACGVRRCELCEVRRELGCAVCGAPRTTPGVLHALARAGRPLVMRAAPGLAGIAAGRPWLGALACLSGATAVAAFVLRGGVVPDPLAAGDVGQVAFGLLAAVLATTSGLCSWIGLSTLRSQQ